MDNSPAARQKRYRLRHPERAKACVEKWRAAHPGHAAAQSKLWHARHPGYGAEYMRKLRQENPWHFRVQKYGISAQQIQSIGDNQSWRCAICTEPLLTARQKNLDHNHKTGKVREFLCTGCNHDLAVLENLEWVAKARFYLEKHNQGGSKW